MIEHSNGHEVQYAHLKDNLEKLPWPTKGALVFQGEWIGNVGYPGARNSGNAHRRPAASARSRKSREYAFIRSMEDTRNSKGSRCSEPPRKATQYSGGTCP